MAHMIYPTDGIASLNHRFLAQAIRGNNTVKQRYEIQDVEPFIGVNWQGYVHHSSCLAAALLESAIDEMMADRAWGAERWTETLSCMWRMDETEKGVIAALAGEPAPDYGFHPQTRPVDVFNAALRRLIARESVRPFFALNPGRPDDGTHYSIRPVGYDNMGDREDLALIANRKALRKLPAADKALLAVITVAYNGDMATEVFKGPGLALKTAPSVRALYTLPDDVQADALRLIANYSGW